MSNELSLMPALWAGTAPLRTVVQGHLSGLSLCSCLHPRTNKRLWSKEGFSSARQETSELPLPPPCPPLPGGTLPCLPPCVGGTRTGLSERPVQSGTPAVLVQLLFSCVDFEELRVFHGKCIKKMSYPFLRERNITFLLSHNCYYILNEKTVTILFF